MPSAKRRRPPIVKPVAAASKYPCTQCGGDALVGFVANKPGDWYGKINVGERLCTGCFVRLAPFAQDYWAWMP
jgi:hypothetical protein